MGLENSLSSVAKIKDFAEKNKTNHIQLLLIPALNFFILYLWYLAIT